MTRLFRCLPALAFITAAAFAAEPPPKLPIEAFFRTRELTQPRLARDGSKVVFLVRNDPKRQSIAVYDVKTGKGGIVFVPNDYNVDFAFWKGDRIVFGGDVGGNESYALRSIKADGSDIKDLSESWQKYQRATNPLVGGIGGSVFSRLPQDDNHILITGYGVRRNSAGELEAAGEPGFYRLNIHTRRRDRVEVLNDRATGYFVDDQSGTVFGRTIQAGTEEIHEIKDLNGNYRQVGRYPGSSAPISFTGLLPGEKMAIMEVRSPNDHDRGALYAFNRATMQREKLLYEPPVGEMVATKRRPDGRIVGITYEAEKPVTDWFDPAWARIYGSLKQTFPGKQIVIVDSTEDLKIHAVFVYSDREPGTYYLFDAATPVITPLGRVNPMIDPEKMADREPIKYQARDGLEIHGYLTRPAGQKDRKHPLVLLPHGGPFGIRDSWDFDPEAQFLANRGYAVLQVNYRGSGGYGARFQESGKHQWGRKMQDDLTDAVAWAIEEGITVKDRVAIYGASYGGYAALAGLVFTPELYRCGINYVGVSDLRILVRPNEQKGRFFDLFTREWIGSDGNDLWERSPLAHVENIRVPSMHAYGENDPRVDIGHWTQLESELKKYDKPYVYLRERDEGHGFENEQSRIKFYAALERFLDLNMLAEGKVTLGELKAIEMPAKE
ncbi:S9 family peptidase [Opitutus terrae]|uniref:Peptidase S9 prolyl oligopeptidase active site domain protein n=1 Tax=Opitutus terrae (strain DSM 11246 / JCM 15787 / PB90-1) TaxID=452637 RepID=B1ZUE8_OPITP|nr:alpha/beta fold hydrolase [Opitutus terrae]ACB73991.1 peptidase S9 prolyl oligopeptidase active site domain protein [Opitutus terrae PB90-1]